MCLMVSKLVLYFQSISELHQKSFRTKVAWELIKMEDGFMKTSDECISYFGVDAERGLTARQVEDNRKKYGPNGECCVVD